MTADNVWSFTTTAGAGSCPSANSLVQNWPVDTQPFPPLLALSPEEIQFAGVACLEGDFDIRWTIESNTPDSRNTCNSCAEPDFVKGQGVNPSYPDGASISVDQSDGFNFGTWLIRAQIFNTSTSLDHQGFEDFNLVVDPAAFQLVAGNTWQDITLSLFGNMPSASRTDAGGSCAAGEFEWTLTFYGGAEIVSQCVSFGSLNPGSAYEHEFTGLIESPYTLTIHYVDGTLSDLGSMQFSRDFDISPP